MSIFGIFGDDNVHDKTKVNDVAVIVTSIAAVLMKPLLLEMLLYGGCRCCNTEFKIFDDNILILWQRLSLFCVFFFFS